MNKNKERQYEGTNQPDSQESRADNRRDLVEENDAI
jgi:hypothetical protein